MTVKERIIAIRLIEKQKRRPDLFRDLVISIGEEKKIDFEQKNLEGEKEYV